MKTAIFQGPSRLASLIDRHRWLHGSCGRSTVVHSCSQSGSRNGRARWNRECAPHARPPRPSEAIIKSPRHFPACRTIRTRKPAWRPRAKLSNTVTPISFRLLGRVGIVAGEPQCRCPNPRCVLPLVVDQRQQPMTRRGSPDEAASNSCVTSVMTSRSSRESVHACFQSYRGD